MTTKEAKDEITRLLAEQKFNDVRAVTEDYVCTRSEDEAKAFKKWANSATWEAMLNLGKMRADKKRQARRDRWDRFKAKFWRGDKFASEQEAQEALEAIDQVAQPISKRIDELKEELERNACAPDEKRIKEKELYKLQTEIGKYGKEYERFVKKCARSKEGIKKW